MSSNPPSPLPVPTQENLIAEQMKFQRLLIPLLERIALALETIAKTNQGIVTRH
jgi:hypothetical protein